MMRRDKSCSPGSEGRGCRLEKGEEVRLPIWVVVWRQQGSNEMEEVGQGKGEIFPPYQFTSILIGPKDVDCSTKWHWHSQSGSK